VSGEGDRSVAPCAIPWSMKDKAEKQHRRSIRLKGYDYANAGAYFVTIVTQGRACLFGEIVNTETRLNDAGSMIERWWFELNNKFSTVETDEFVIMPNHFHGIVVIADVGADLRVGPVGRGAGENQDVNPTHPGTHAGVLLQGTHRVRPGGPTGAHIGAPVQRASLPAVVQWFKTMTTNEYLRGVKTSAWAPFQGQVWQRNYYEHVIRDEESLNRIRQYIADNPIRWEFDPENPDAKTPNKECLTEKRATSRSPLP
jgi:putative transposase